MQTDKFILNLKEINIYEKKSRKLEAKKIKKKKKNDIHKFSSMYVSIIMTAKIKL